MNKKMRMGIMGVLALAMVSMGVPFVFAQGGHHWDDEKTGEKGKTHFEKMYEDLNITAEQKTQLEANRASHRDAARKLREKTQAKREELKQELSKAEFNEAKIKAIHNELKTLLNEMEDSRLAGIVAVKKILTPEQFSKLQKKMEGFKARHKDSFKKRRKEKNEAL